MAQASRKVIAPEADLDETTLAAPRFDEAAAQQARPVVPLSSDAGYVPQVSHAAVRRARPSYLPANQGSWLIAAFVGLILGAGAMALGVVAYRRNHTAVPARSLVPAVAAVRPELDQDFRARPSSHSIAPTQPTVAGESQTEAVDNGPTAAAAAEPKRTKRRTVVTSLPAENDASENSDAGQDSSGKPRPRLVDRYVVPSSRP
ncbi:MAG TPA: hypothetical protein VF544_10980 [Pyrinomonadaceae bacterium]|jgi:hypothetical protein